MARKMLQNLICLFFFLLPWQTIWIYHEAFLNGSKWEYGTLGFYATEILLWIIILLFIIWYWKESKFRNLEIKKFSFTKDRVFLLACLLFIIYNLSSIFWSIDKNLALQQTVRILEAVLLFLIIFIGPFEKEKLVRWFVYGAVLPSFLGIWQFFSQTTFASTILGLTNHPVWQAGTSIIQSDLIGRWLRAYGPFSHPNVFGGYLTIVLLSYCFIVDFSKYQSVKNKVFFLVIYILCCVALFFTFSRAAWAAMFIGLLSYCFIIKKHNNSIRQCHNILIPVIIFAILSFIYFPLVFTRASVGSSHEVQSIEERAAGYSQAKKLFIAYPLLGVGAGNYTFALYNSGFLKGGWELQPVHNAFVLFMVEQGIIGVLLLLFIVISFFKLQIGERKMFVLMFLSFFVLMFFDHYLYSSYVGLILGGAYFSLILKDDTQVLPR